MIHLRLSSARESYSREIANKFYTEEVHLSDKKPYFLVSSQKSTKRYLLLAKGKDRDRAIAHILDSEYLSLFKMISFIKYRSVNIVTTAIRQNVPNSLPEYDSQNLSLRRHSRDSSALTLVSFICSIENRSSSESVKTIRFYYDSSQAK